MYHGGLQLALLGVVCAGLAGLGGIAARQLDDDLARPRDLHTADYVTSDACRRCHPSHAASHRSTYHSRMTQLANERSVLGQFDGRTLDYAGVRARMQRDAQGAFQLAFSSARGEQWSARVERTVGSHRYQQYLARDGDVFFRLPIAWDIAAGRFIHMNGAFLTPDPALDAGQASAVDYNRHVTRWNDNCVFCHNVHPNPGLDPRSGEFATEVAELGVACEACHGPGSEHVARNGNPIRRYALHTGGAADPTIKNPARMSGARSAEVCGRCHGQRLTAHVERFLADGDPYIPGEALSDYSTPLARDTHQNGQPGLFEARFWPDGTPRLTAYEYQGYLQSPCRADEHFSCESCHAMHRGDPAGQLQPERVGDAACTGCHRDLASPLAASAHSHHPVERSVSCVQCHMPDVVYGLVSVQLSHHIEVPDPARQARDARPDACTLCHVDQTRRWAIEAAERWRNPTASVSQVAHEEAGLPEQSEQLLAGDPIERAVAAHALGAAGARYEPNHAPALLGLLAEVMQYDTYPAVRSIAARSLAARLRDSQPSAAELAARYVATDDAATRAALLSQLTAAMPTGSLSPPTPAVSAALRASAADVAIEIGE